MLIRVLSLLIGAILGLSNSGVVWGAKDGTQPPGNGLIAFADAPGSKLGPEPWPDAHIFTVNSDGQNRKRLTTGPGGYLWPVWSPGGDKIACMRLINNTPEIWILGRDGTAQRKITVGFLPAWSPEGDKIAFWSGDEKGFGQLWVMNSDGNQKKQLTFPEKNDYTSKGSSANAPAWLYSKRIAYWAGIEHAYGQIWVMDQDGRNKTQLTRAPAPASNDNPVWSPDGTKLLFDTNRRGTAEIWAIDADGSNERVLISDVRVMPARASWQPVRSSK